jgi:hypothetical protein
MYARITLSCLLGLVASCGAADDRAKFEGTWVFQAGSTFSVACPGQPAQVLDLTNVPPSGTPAHFMLSALAATKLHEIDGLGCNYDWAVAGAHATLDPPQQSCAQFPDGHGGMTTMTAQSGEKDSSDGKSMIVHIDLVAGPCSATVAGTAIKQ